MVSDSRVPTEFLYWQRADSPWVRRARRAWHALLRFDPLPPDDVVRSFAHGYYDADPVAEAFVDEAYLAGDPRHGRRMLDQALEEGVASVRDAPASLVRLFREFERDPEWVDHELVERGARVFRRFGPAVFSYAGVTTLEMYSESSIAKPLSLAGGYAGDRAHHRFMETARFWIDVSEPGGLRGGPPAAPGRAAAMRVRVMHVFIRRRLLGHPEWDLDAWGVPISQSDALLTLMGGSISPGLGLWLMGFQTPRKDIEALLHFWRYVGHLMGVQPRWYPAGVQESVQLMFAAMLKRAYTAGPDGAELVESYPRAFAPKGAGSWRRRLRDEINYRAQVGYTRYFMSPLTYRRHRMPNPWPWALHPLAQFPVIFGLETIRRLVPQADDVADRYARWRRETWYRNEMGDRPARFEPAAAFRR
jgi:hypothetical protein